MAPQDTPTRIPRRIANQGRTKERGPGILAAPWLSGLACDDRRGSIGNGLVLTA